MFEGGLTFADASQQLEKALLKKVGNDPRKLLETLLYMRNRSDRKAENILAELEKVERPKRKLFSSK
jgi:hypothetical protein